MTVTDVRWVERPGGVRLPYVVLGSSPRRLLFGHSLLAGGVQGAAVFKPIVEAGWTVIAMDQRGHGLSERPGSWTADDFRLDVLGADLLAILDDAGWDTAWIGGGSMGAATSTAAALTAPERAEGLLLMAPAIGGAVNPALERFLPVADAFEASIEAGLRAWAGISSTAPARVEAHEVALRKLGRVGAPALLRAIAGWHFSGSPSFEVPVVTSAWEGDPVHPKQVALDLAAASPRGVFHPLDLSVDANFFAHCARQLTAAVGTAPGGPR